MNISKPTQINTIWAVTGTKTDPGTAKSNTGWVVELPPYQTANYIEWKQDTFIAHANQHGVPVWDSVTEYQGGQSYTKGSNGLIYKAILTSTNIDPVNPLNTSYWAQAFEVYGSVAVVQNQLTTHLQNYATLSGITNVTAARQNLSVWSRAESDARYAALAGNSSQTFSVALATDPSHAVPLQQVASLLTQATEANVGVAAIASMADTAQGTNDTKIITPLKAATVYLSKAGNLAGLSNVAVARNNLGLGSIATEAATGFLRTTNNLSDLVSASVARANLGLTSTAIQPETYFLRTANNLSDVTPAAARTNLGLTSTATTALSALMLKSENLAGLSSVAAARNNLGLADTATLSSATFLKTANNLAELSNPQAARNNLGLGSAATKNTAGVDGDLDFTALLETNGYSMEPSGLIKQWGVVNVGYDSAARVTFPKRFTSQCFHFHWMMRIDSGYDGTVQASTGMQGFYALSTTGCTILNGDNKSGPAYWFAIGV